MSWTGSDPPTITYTIRDYIESRFGPVVPKDTRPIQAESSSPKFHEITNADKAWCLRITLPGGLLWDEVVRRQVCLSDGTVIEPGVDVRSAGADALYNALSDFGLGPQQVTLGLPVTET